MIEDIETQGGGGDRDWALSVMGGLAFASSTAIWQECRSRVIYLLGFQEKPDI